MTTYKLSIQHLLMCSTLLLVILTSDASARHRTNRWNASERNQLTSDANARHRTNRWNASERNQLTSDANARHKTNRWNASKRNQHAVANIRPCNKDDNIRGWAHLEEKQSHQGVKKVTVKIELRGWDIPDGEHGLHIHEVANCEPCGDAGGHFDPGPNSNSSPDGNHPFHMGDLVNINVNDGYGRLLNHNHSSHTLGRDQPVSLMRMEAPLLSISILTHSARMVRKQDVQEVVVWPVGLLSAPDNHPSASVTSCDFEHHL